MMNGSLPSRQPVPEEGWLAATLIRPMPRGLYRVRLEDGREVTAHRAGAARMSQARLTSGTAVWVVLATQDPTRGRIMARR
jgi:translation initiation factor IF-1